MAGVGEMKSGYATLATWIGGIKFTHLSFYGIKKENAFAVVSSDAETLYHTDYVLARRDFNRAVKRLSKPDPVVLKGNIASFSGPKYLVLPSGCDFGEFEEGQLVKVTIEPLESD